MDQRAGVILHRGRVVLYPEAGGGITWAIEPVLAVEPSPAAVAPALEEVLGASRVGAPMPNLRDYKDPVRKVLKVRSERQLCREGAMARVRRTDAGWALQPLAPVDETRWEPDGPEIVLDASNGAGTVAGRLLAELEARLP